ncbi:alpha-1B adrenergic receptor-like [Lytechinus variegatus]|uniref:alpha-1B adrenergic receptor-like n=1 Tax=Lytechinus variegatus TaxID=7654 RepID=UPI001BB2989C|nr:alpha-1B adrenergic receptor-like [Lytechinus variegatus]
MVNDSVLPTTSSSPDMAPNNTEEGPSFYSNLNSVHLVIYLIVTLSIAIAGIIGNSIVILAIILSRKLRSTLNFFVLNLACADLLISICIPCDVSNLLLPESRKIRFWLYAILTGIAVSLTTHAFIAFTSWYLITRSHARSKNLYTTRNITIMISFTWLFTIIVASIIHAANKAGYYRAIVVEGTYILAHLVVIIVSYLKLWCFVAKQEKKPKPPPNRSKQNDISVSTMSNNRNGGQSVVDSSSEYNGPPSSPATNKTAVEASDLEHCPRTEHDHRSSRKVPTDRQREERALHRKTKTMAVTKSLLVVLVMFIICFIPYPFTLWLDPHFSTVQPWGVALMFFNSCINPIIYAGKIRGFREVMACIIGCRFRSMPMPVEWFRKLRDSG